MLIDLDDQKVRRLCETWVDAGCPLPFDMWDDSRIGKYPPKDFRSGIDAYLEFGGSFVGMNIIRFCGDKYQELLQAIVARQKELDNEQ